MSIGMPYGMWVAMREDGAPETITRLLKANYDGIQVQVRVDVEFLNLILIQEGLHQRCNLS